MFLPSFQPQHSLKEMCSMRNILFLASCLLWITGSLANKPIDYYKENLYSSSVRELSKLLELENHFMSKVNAYADTVQEKLETLKVFLQVYARAPQGKDKYVSNPVKEFSLIRRLRQEWIVLQKYLSYTIDRDQFQEFKTILSSKPNIRDMQQALKGMNRIEETYGLKATDIALGRLQNKQYNKTLFQRDFVAIGNHNYEMKNFSKAAIWYHLALKPPKLEANAKLYTEALGKPTRGLRYKFARAVQMHAALLRNPSRNSTELIKEVDEVIDKTSSIDLENYVREQLAKDIQQLISEKVTLQPKATSHDLGCRGLFPKPKNLSCRYNFTTSPFLRLAPLKMEEISRNPYIVMYHNVLSDLEIDDMHRLSGDMTNGLSGPLRRNQTNNVEIIARTKALQRSSPFRELINQRTADMTGFKQPEFPTLVLVNYGLGTFFTPHYDCVHGDRIKKEDLGVLGDRLATVLIYASHVEQGGSTVFPNIKISVAPQKGSSLVWYNTNDDGTPDLRSLHSVCPIIVGSRWTITKWIHINPQMFVKPCAARN